MVNKLLKKLRDLDPGVLSPIEFCFKKVDSDKRLSGAPALILLALPRSGSTFCYQAICHFFDVNYFSNFFYFGMRYPFLFNWLQKKILKEYSSDFKSEYGFVRGLNGPAEANDIWGDWFDQKLIEDIPSPKVDKVALASSFIDGNYESSQKPFVSGWVGHVLYANEMARLFPNAIFVHLHRDNKSIVSSLLNARKNHLNDINEWFSVRPKECQRTTSLTPEEEVGLQVQSLQSRLGDFASSHASRVVHLRYDELTSNMGSAMLSLERQLLECDFKINRRVDFD